MFTHLLQLLVSLNGGNVKNGTPSISMSTQQQAFAGTVTKINISKAVF